MRVALLIESSRAYGRGLLRGVAAYARAHGPWSIFQHERALGDAPPSWLSTWQGDGIIARIESQRMVDVLQRLKLPTVDLRGLYSMPGIPLIETNDLTVIRMACDHIISRGFREVAFCGFSGANYSERRKRFVVDHLAEVGINPHVYDSPHARSRDTTRIEAEGLHDEVKLGNWLERLPKPIGLVACNDLRAQQLLNVCREQSIRVPDDIAVVGIDNDALICELTDPPLSSVEVDTHRIGYLAAELLEQMVHGKSSVPEVTLVSPIRVVTRRSSDILSVDDKVVAAAIRYIRDHAYGGISVEDVARHVRVSRSTLDRRFVKTIGKTPKSEINRVLLARIQQLLVDTDYKLPEIARRTGFAHAEYLSTMFREKVGMTPGEYRNVHPRQKP